MGKTQVIEDNTHNLGSSLKMKSDDALKHKQIEDLKEKVEILEKEKISLINNFQSKENNYIERIKKLENIIHASDKWDMFSLEKQNKEYEIKLINLSRQVIYLQDEISKEKEKNNSFIGELMMLKQQLVEEIAEIKNFKVNTFKKGFGEKLISIGATINEEKSENKITSETVIRKSEFPSNTNLDEFKDKKTNSAQVLSSTEPKRIAKPRINKSTEDFGKDGVKEVILRK